MQQRVCVMKKIALALCLLLILHQTSNVIGSSKERNLQPLECRCGTPPPFEDSVDAADMVLRVRIKKLKRETVERKVYKGKVKKIFKGSIDSKIIQIKVDSDENSCGYFPLKNNTDYLIFQDNVPDTKFAIGQCFWDTTWKDLLQERKEFLHKLDVSGSPTGNVSYVRTPRTDPLPAEIRTVDETIMEGYTNCSDLEYDIEQYLRFYASHVILDLYYLFSGGFGLPEDDIAEDSFGTNNQIQGVDEADIVKSDGTYVFLAYGDTLVVWNATSGEEVTREIMPRPEEVVEEECNSQFNPSLPPANCYRGLNSDATIKAILLEGQKLVLIVSGYDFDYYPYVWEGDVASNGGRAVSALSGYGSSTLRVYNTSALCEDGLLKLLATKHLTGGYMEARSIGTKAHIVTRASINKHAHLDAFLRRSNPRYENLNDTEYQKEAVAVAEEIIPLFASRIVAELDDDGQCKGITKLVAFVTASSVRDLHALSDFTNNVENLYIRQRLLESFDGIVIVTSFHMDEDFGARPVGERRSVPGISTESATSFFRTYGPSMITASENRMIFAELGPHWRRHEEPFTPSLCTYILVFNLPSGREDGAAEPSGFASLEGRPINKLAIDEYKGHLRIGITQDARWGCVQYGFDMVGRRYCRKSKITRNNENHVVILEYPQLENNTVMKETARVANLGKPGESLFAVRFRGDKAFAVTFQMIDPFYTLDLSDPKDPFEVGELEITGFSNYLHLIENDQFVLSVGQEADDRGRIIGMAVSLFNVADFESPSLAARYVVEDDPNIWSYSSASFDFKAFRYLPESGVLILPLTTYGRRQKKDFTDGFLILRVDTELPKISFELFIDHAELRKRKFCYSPAYLPSRSLVFRGKATTMKGHVVMSTDLNTEEPVWVLDLDEDRDEEDCFGWF